MVADLLNLLLCTQTVKSGNSHGGGDTPIIFKPLGNVMILVLSPHTDDIEFGCGGSLIKWKEEGHEIHVVAFSACEESLLEGWDKNSTRKEFVKSMNTLGASYEILNYPVRRFDEHRQDILEDIVKSRKVNPYITLIPSLQDYHQDHYLIAKEATRAIKGNLLSYELHNIGFKPNFYVELTRRQVTKKIGLTHFYKSQIAKNRKMFNDEYVYGLAKIRGGDIEKDYAEGFEAVRWLY